MSSSELREATLPSPTLTRPAWLTWALPVLVAGVLWSPGIGAGSIINGDDALYGMTIRALLESGDPWPQVLRWRPPLYFAFAWASASGLGLNELGLRLPGLVFALACVAATAWFGQRLFAGLGHAVSHRIGLLAGLAIALSGQFAVFARTVRGIDALFVLCAVLAVVLALGAPERPRRWLLAGLCTGLAFLTKSVVVATLFLPLVWLVYTAADSWRERVRAALLGLVPALAVGCVWPISLWLQASHGLTDHVTNHVVRRATGAPMIGAETGPTWYLEQLVSFEGIAGVLGLVGAVALLAESRLPWRIRALPALWIVSVFGLFSAATTKLSHYILPAYPALAVALVAAGILLLQRWLRPALQTAALIGLLLVSMWTAPAQTWLSLGSADFAPADRDAGLVARAELGGEGEMLVWSHYHVGAQFYFGGATRMLTDNPGMLSVYRQTHGFIEDVTFRELAVQSLPQVLQQAAPACLWVPAPRLSPAVVAAMESVSSGTDVATQPVVLSGRMWCSGRASLEP